MEKTRVLVVDDIAETRENVRKLIQFEADIEVVGTARGGRESIRLTDELKPDVIIMDINMPDMDGITATEMIRQRNLVAQIIILSVQGSPNYMRRAMLAGARDFLTKPPMVGELVSAIRRAGEMARAERSELHKIDLEPKKLELAQLELSINDCSERIILYQQNLILGKLIDQIERLLTGIAHDIRSPLSIATNILEIIELPEPSHQQSLQRIIQRLIFAKAVTDNFLGLCFSEKVSILPISLSKTVQAAISCVTEQIPKKIRIQFRADIPENLLVFSDGNVLKLILVNLLINSIESIDKPSGTIRISTQTKDDDVYLWLTDNGQPIPGTISPNLFKLGVSTKPERLGIGLYVARKLSNAIKVEVEYRPVSGEKSFVLKLNQREIDAFELAKLENAKMSLGNLQAHLEEFRQKKIPAKRQAEFASEFHRYTTIFTYRLIRELLIAETYLLGLYAELPDHLVEARQALMKAARNCIYCRLLASNVLEIDGGDTLKIENLSVSDVLQEVLLLAERKIPESRYSVEYEIDPLLDEIEADRVKLMQVFMNLIRNAVDAMPEGGRFAIFVGQQQEMVVVKITDTGVGIAPENFSKLFQIGFSTKPNGYGIGLHSVKSIIDKHHGTITVDSRIRKGTTFTIWLPVHQPK